MTDGHQIVFEKQGDQSPDITAGDLIFILKLQEHPIFRREAGNLYIKQHLSLTEVFFFFFKL